MGTIGLAGSIATVVDAGPNAGPGVLGLLALLLDMRGPEFLALYIGLVVVALVLAAFLRSRLRGRAAVIIRPEAMRLDPYETAYLSGGDRLAVNVALASLYHRQLLTVDEKDKKLTASAAGPPAVRA